MTQSHPPTRSRLLAKDRWRVCPKQLMPPASYGEVDLRGEGSSKVSELREKFFVDH